MVKNKIIAYRFYPHFFAIFILSFSFLLLPTDSYAANITTTTVTARVKVDDFATTTEQYFRDTVKLNLKKDNYSYNLDYKNIDGGYAIFQKTISRCSSANVDSTGWQIGVSPVAARAGQVLVYGNQNICGNPTFTWDYRLIGADWSRSGGTSCGACSTSTAPVQGPLTSITGVLKHVTGQGMPAEDKIYYVDTPAANDASLNLGTNLTSPAINWGTTGTHTLGSTYSCIYMEPLSAPTQVKCEEGTTPPANLPTTPDGSTTTPASGTSPSATAANGEMTIGLNADINASAIDGTKCPADAVRNKDGELSYTKGVLAGVSCERATKTLEDVLLIVKNIVTTLLLPIVGVLFTIMLLIGGILYISSRGNQAQADRGKKTLTAAIIGLLIVILSYTLISIFTNIIGGGIT